jgi:hypothetical protein
LQKLLKLQKKKKKKKNNNFAKLLTLQKKKKKNNNNRHFMLNPGAWSLLHCVTDLPMFSTPRALAFDSLLLSSRLHTSPVFFHHLSYRIWIMPFFCSSRMAREILSLHGDPVRLRVFFGRSVLGTSSYNAHR